MSNRKYRPFKVTSTVDLKFIARFTEEGIVADCLDAGAAGVGESIEDALSDLVGNIEVLFRAVGKQLKVEARRDELELFASLASGAEASKAGANVVAWGTISRRKIEATSVGKKLNLKIPTGERFEVTQLAKAA